MCLTLDGPTDSATKLSVAHHMVGIVIEPERILEGLDEEQRLVATTLAGPLVVLAGAGTGKTRAMTHRIAYGVAVGAFDPNSVLALTFTTRAASEMRSRLRRLGVPRVAARTFHSAALRQVQHFWPTVHGKDFPPVADSRIRLVAEACKREGITPDSAVLRDLSTEISWAKVNNVGASDYAETAVTASRFVAGREPDEVARLLVRYESVKQAHAVVDFEDILLCNASLLITEPRIAAQVNGQYRHLIVDEYQDVSPLQQALLELWRGKGEELCVVGDPAQTIHSFAGAKAEYLTTFGIRHPNATKVELVRDYRSTPQVVKLANHIMRGRGPSVELVAQRAAGPEPVLRQAVSERAEAADTASWLLNLNKRGVEWSQMAVLYRIHAQSPTFEAALAEVGIPFYTRGSEGFFERPEVRAALRAFAAASKVESDAPPNSLLKSVLTGMGWTTEPPVGQGSLRERWESWSALVDLGDDFVASHPEVTTDDLVAELENRAHVQHAPTGGGVTLSSLHAAKGLEWDAVAVTGVHEGSLPFVLASTPAAIEEERRLLYVGVTRAREHLQISWSVTRNGGGTRRARSRFLDGLAGEQVSERQPSRRRRGDRKSALTAVCRVCGRGLTSGAERKIGRHLDCESSYDEALWEALRQWRKAEAEQAKVPAFVVFTDATLLAIAESLPRSREQMHKIPGVGSAKLDRYADAVLGIVADHI